MLSFFGSVFICANPRLTFSDPRSAREDLRLIIKRRQTGHAIGVVFFIAV
jgi:hypothetical protein